MAFVAFNGAAVAIFCEADAVVEEGEGTAVYWEWNGLLVEERWGLCCELTVFALLCHVALDPLKLSSSAVWHRVLFCYLMFPGWHGHGRCNDDVAGF